MQQRQLRLGDILDDYCPRERRVTNHAIVAMVGPDVKQTRCVTCDTEHEYKHAKVPRQRRKAETPAALSSPPVAGGPKRVAHESVPDPEPQETRASPNGSGAGADEPSTVGPPATELRKDIEVPERLEQMASEDNEDDERDDVEEGPVHRPLIRATLPRAEGQPPPTRPAPEFTIRQPAGRQGRFRPRHQQAITFHGNRSGNTSGGGVPRQGGGRPPMPHSGKRHGSGRKRSK